MDRNTCAGEKAGDNNYVRLHLRFKLSDPRQRNAYNTIINRQKESSTPLGECVTDIILGDSYTDIFPVSRAEIYEALAANRDELRKDLVSVMHAEIQNILSGSGPQSVNTPGNMPVIIPEEKNGEMVHSRQSESEKRTRNPTEEKAEPTAKEPLADMETVTKPATDKSATETFEVSPELLNIALSF